MYPDMNNIHNEWVNMLGYIDRAKNLLVFHGDQFLASHNGTGFQRWCKLIMGWVYGICTWHIEATDCGASIWSSYSVFFVSQVIISYTFQIIPQAIVFFDSLFWNG